MPANTTDLEKRLWDAADELRANSKLKASEYGEPVLGLIFLRHADARFTEAEKRLQGNPHRPAPAGLEIRLPGRGRGLRARGGALLAPAAPARGRRSGARAQ